MKKIKSADDDKWSHFLADDPACQRWCKHHSSAAAWSTSFSHPSRGSRPGGAPPWWRSSLRRAKHGRSRRSIPGEISMVIFSGCMFNLRVQMITVCARTFGIRQSNTNQRRNVGIRDSTGRGVAREVARWTPQNHEVPDVGTCRPRFLRVEVFCPSTLGPSISR